MPLPPPIYVCLNEKNRFRTIWFLFYLLITIFLTNFVHDAAKENLCIVCNIQMAFRRLPAFLMGMYMSPYIMSSKKVHLEIMACCTLLGYIVFHLLMCIYEWWLYVPLLLVICCYLIRIMENSIFDKLILWLGGASLESYITNVETKAIMPSILEKFRYQSIFVGNYLGYILVIMVGLTLTYLCHRVSNQINKIFIRH